MKVKILKNWHFPDLLRQTPGCTGRWGDVVFTLDRADEDYDYLLVLNHTSEVLSGHKNPKQWLMLQEPYLKGIFDWVEEGHEAYGKIFTHHIFTHDERYVATQTCLPWHVDKTYDELVSLPVPEKKKKISMIASNKTFFPGHKRRMAFYEAIKDGGLGIDFFGRGIHEIEDKFEGLAPYEFSIAIENSATPHYWTEKIADCYLAYTMPIYYGCTNIDRYFPKESYLAVDIDDPHRSMQMIREAVEANVWRENLEYLREARDLVLNKYQIFPYISEVLDGMERGGACRT